jgi:hypothetical protein
MTSELWSLIRDRALELPVRHPYRLDEIHEAVALTAAGASDRRKVIIVMSATVDTAQA